jgi:hypothetical protein
VTITSAAEQTFVYNQVLLPNIGAPRKFPTTWIGAYQPPGSQEPSGGWAWVTGESWSYSNWDAGEPNNGVGYNLVPENVSLMYGTELWNDSKPDFAGIPGAIWPSGYMVEFGPVPEPSILTILGLGAAALMISRRRK